MKIPLLNIRVRRIQILGQECRSVGTVDQTIQGVSDGKLQGTIHLSATVIRNLYDNFNVDCLASVRLSPSLLVMLLQNLVMTFWRKVTMMKKFPVWTVVVMR